MIGELTSRPAVDGRVGWHPNLDVLSMSAEQILQFYVDQQQRDLAAALDAICGRNHTLLEAIPSLLARITQEDREAFGTRFSRAQLDELFHILHAHVMSHPVWQHAIFHRIAKADLTRDQLVTFATQYFNQVKNTRQCVAMALGRFNTLEPSTEFPSASNAIMEATETILAGLLADEYGYGTGAIRSNDAETDAGRFLRQAFGRPTHPALYRRFLTALGIDGGRQDVPALPGVADNIIVQRLVAANPAYTRVDALAAVGLGMEWGVPTFFSMIIVGIYKLNERDQLGLSPHDIEIWTAHVDQDVEHAIAMFIVMALNIKDSSKIEDIKTTVSLVLGFRHAMMDDIYKHVFGYTCEPIELAPSHCLNVEALERIQRLLAAARNEVTPETVINGLAYATSSFPNFLEMT